MLRWVGVRVLAAVGMLAAGTLVVACDSSGGADDDGGEPAICCDAECVSMLGGFTFKSGGATTTVSGSASITELSTGTVLAAIDMTGSPTLEAGADEATLAQFDGQTIQVEVLVEAVGFAPFSETFSLDVATQEVCCSSCINATGRFDIELGTATNTFVDGCNPGGGDPACPLTLPNTFDSCSAALCCNYDAGNGEVIGCTCNTNGTSWTCGESACTCSSR